MQLDTLCDVCLGDGVETDASAAYRINIDGLLSRSLDLCAAHDHHVAELLVIMEKYGSALPPPPKRRYRAAPVLTASGAIDRNPDSREPVADRTCPVCGAISKSRNGLRSHVKNHHGQNLTELGAAKLSGVVTG